MPAEPNQSKTLQAQKIACVNNDAFVMNFEVAYSKNGDGAEGRSEGSGNYPINQSHTIDLKDKGLRAGDLIWPHVSAVAKDGERIAYAPNGQTVTCSVTGTTLIYDVNRIS